MISRSLTSSLNSRTFCLLQRAIGVHPITCSLIYFQVLFLFVALMSLEILNFAGGYVGVVDCVMTGHTDTASGLFTGSGYSVRLVERD